MTAPRLEHATRWVTEGTARLLAALEGLDDAALDADTALPGWTRRHLLAHLASNAEALNRLLTWAATGVEHPMYASTEQRAAEIERGAVLPAEELRAWVIHTAAELDEAMAALDAAAWDAEVVTIQGRKIQAREVTWLRSREVCIHLVDLQAGVSFSDLPVDFCVGLAVDVAAWRRRAAPTAIRIDTPDVSVALGDIAPGDAAPGDTVDSADTVLALSTSQAAAWLTGREHRADLPALAPWI